MSSPKVMMVRDNALHERQFDCENKGCTAVVEASDYAELAARLHEVERELLATKAALKRYGRHEYDCSHSDDTYNDGPWPCSCGFGSATGRAGSAKDQESARNE